ncbi:MAG: fimbrillin family protein [Parabacteroides gordonii]|nr:fimbrillin family protein [Parabacteroides gordonii]
MKQTIYIGIAVISLLTACQEEINDPGELNRTEKISFQGTLQSGTSVTRAASVDILDDTHGQIWIHQNVTKGTEAETEAVKDTACYQVKSGYWGTLEPTGEIEGLDWYNKNGDVIFHAWTMPEGVTLTDGSTAAGTVNFNTANSGLEHLIGTRVVGNYSKSPTVTLPFKHLVSKVTFYSIKLPNNETVHNAEIHFTQLAESGDLKTGTDESDSGVFPSVTGGSNKDTDIEFSYNNGNNKTVYLPPLSFNKESANGDFYIEVEGTTYYGTLNRLKLEGKEGYTELDGLKAGEHLILSMYLTEGNGVGIGPDIKDWKYEDDGTGSGQIFSGITSAADWMNLVNAIAENNGIPEGLVGGNNIIRLYDNIDLTGQTIPDNLNFSGYTLDGQGYTITLPAGSNGLFGAIGDADGSSGSTTTVIKNLYLAVASSGTVNANGLLANTATNATIENCHALSGSITPTTGSTESGNSSPAGGLIGTANTGTKLSFCSSVIPVTSTDNSAGGLIGEVTSDVTDVTITGCYAQCSVKAGSSSNAGGLVGNMAAGTMTYSFFCFGNSASITEGTNKGILAGTNSGTINNCYWGIANSSTTLLSPIGGSADSPTGSYAFLIQKLTQEEGKEGEKDSKHNVTYQAGTLGSFEGENKVLFKAATGNDNNLMLLDALRTGTNSTDTGKDWVWVYGKDYPVVRIK